MKTLILFLGIGFCSAILLANPVMPVFISEIYFENDDWTIELYNYEFFPGNLACLWIATETETVYFNSGVQIFYDEILLITQNDLQEPLYLNKNGDTIRIAMETIAGVFEDYVSFGNTSINAPYPGQSLARMVLHEYMYDGNFLLAKENQPSIGENPFQVTSRGTLAGYVYDANENPVANAEIRFSPSDYYMDDIFSNENGYFENNNMFGMNYNVKVYINNSQFGNVNLTVEPDSTTFHAFYTNYVSAEPVELQYPNLSLSNFPNPFYLAANNENNTTISFSVHERFLNSKDFKITIFNLKGQKIKTLDCTNLANFSDSRFSSNWNGKDEKGKHVQTGVYFYVLELYGREIATDKMIILK